MRNTRIPAEWHSLFDEQFRSGLTKTQFCRLHGITRSAFSNAWLRLSASDASITPFSFRTPSRDRRKQARASQCNPAYGECYLSSARKPAAHSHLTQRYPLPARRYPATLAGHPAAGDGTMKMFVEPPAIWLYPEHIDFRKSINDLVLIVDALLPWKITLP